MVANFQNKGSIGGGDKGESDSLGSVDGPETAAAKKALSTRAFDATSTYEQRQEAKRAFLKLFGSGR